MRLHRSRAIVQLAWYHLHHSRETWVDIFWFPIINTFTIGGLATYVNSTGLPIDLSFTVLAVLLWYVIEVGSYSLSLGVLWEVWSKSFSSLFISPLTLGEFIVGHMMFSFVKAFLLLIIVSLIAYFVFGYSMLSFGVILLPAILLLISYGWAIAMIVMGLIFRFGTNIQSLAWGLVFVFQPFVGIFYPASQLPDGIRMLAYAFAPTHIFSAGRTMLQSGVADWGSLGVAAVLNVLWLVAGITFMRRMWNWSRVSGALARMEH